LPYTVAGNLGPYTSAYTDSPWIPRAALLKYWYSYFFPSSYAGARCTFKLTAVTHPEYTLDTSLSTMTVASPQL
jgi:hypothetical protein